MMEAEEWDTVEREEEKRETDEQVEAKDGRFIEGRKKENNRTKGNWDHNYFKGYTLGNSVTGTVRRGCIAPAAYRRLVERKFNLDIEQHCITDYHASHKFSKNNKNPFPIAVSVANSERNVRNLNESTATKRAKSRDADPKLIHLSEINAGLYLCNLDALEHGGSEVSACATIINLTPTKIGRKGDYDSMRSRMKDLGCPWSGSINFDTITFRPKYKDMRAMTFGELRDLIRETSLMIERGLERSRVLIVCETGINKAPSVAIGYAVTRLNWTYDRAVDYVDTLKLQHYDNWDNLTVVRLKNYLRALASPTTETPLTEITATTTTAMAATTQ